MCLKVYNNGQASQISSKVVQPREVTNKEID
jgi:hypothetical protein